MMQEEMQEGEIAQRTRSKLPLNDTSISAIEGKYGDTMHACLCLLASQPHTPSTLFP